MALPRTIPSGGVVNALGPYERWMVQVGKRYDLPDLMLDGARHLSAVAELAAPVALNGSGALPGLTPPAGSGMQARLPLLWRAPGAATRFLPFLLSPLGSMGTAPLTLDLDQMQALVAGLAPGGNAGGFRLNFPLRDESVIAGPGPADSAPACDPALAGRAPRVILAIIDHGIPFAHGAYRQAETGGTRIDYCWSQSAPAPAASDPGPHLLFGREFRRDRIDALVAQHGGDEEAVYRAARLLSRPDGPPMPLSRMASHGAHCLDLLAGSWPAATAPEARIIAVDLPASPVWETSGFGKDMFLLSALHYIFDRADRLRDLYETPDLPLVINLSYGHSGGAGDGSSLIETALAELVEQRNARAATTMVMPAGNTFGADLFAHVTEAHFPAAPGPREVRLQWLAPPDDRTSSFLEFWYPPGFEVQNVALGLAAPGGAEFCSTAGLMPGVQGIAAKPIVIGGKVVGQLSLDLHRGTRWRVTICLAPTATFAAPSSLVVGGAQHGCAPAGPWTLTLRLPPGVALPETASLAGRSVIGGIQARIQRDTSYGQGLTGARQSRFLDPLDAPFAPQGHPARDDSAAKGALLRRFGTLNGMAGAPGVLVVAGSDASLGRAADYSGAGLLAAANPGQAIGQDVALSAPSETAPALPGRRAAGTRSGTSFGASGTSAASPLVARALAEAQVATPLPPGADLDAVLARLTALPLAQPTIGTNPGPTGPARLGEIVMQA